MSTDFLVRFLFFFNVTATTDIYTLSLHDALPIYAEPAVLAHLADDLAVHRPDAVPAREAFLDLGRQQLVVVRPEVAAQLLLLLAVPDVHQSSKLQAQGLQNAGAHAGGEAAVDDERVPGDERRVLRREERCRRCDLLGTAEAT